MSEFFTFNIGTRLTFTGIKASWNDIISVNPQLSKINLNSRALTTTVSMKLRPSRKVQISTVLSSGFRNPNIDDIIYDQIYLVLNTNIINSRSLPLKFTDQRLNSKENELNKTY